MLFLVPLILGCVDTFVISQGGVGSSAFMQQLVRANVSTNHPHNHDGVKHAFPSRFTFGDTLRIGPHCSRSAIVIIGDVAHAIASTTRRFQMRHLNTLRVQADMAPMAMADFDRLSVLKIAESGMPQFQHAWHVIKAENVKVLSTAELYASVDPLLTWVRKRALSPGTDTLA